MQSHAFIRVSFEIETHKRREKRKKQWNHIGRDWSNVTTSQGMLQLPVAKKTRNKLSAKALPTSRFVTSNCARINSCSVKPPDLWLFVMAAPEK